MKKTVIILAAGLGTRFGSNKPKQFHKVDGKTLIDIVIQKYNDYDEIILTFNKEYKDEYPISEKIKLIEGGSTRKESLCNAIKVVTGDLMMIHEVARYNVSNEIISAHLSAMKSNLFSNTMIESRDTIYKISQEKISEIGKTGYFMGQGPQMYNMGKIESRVFHDFFEIEEDLDLFTHLLNEGLVPYMVKGDKTADKVTYNGDA